MTHTKKKDCAMSLRVGTTDRAQTCRVYVKPRLHLGGRLDERLVSHGLGAVPAVFRATAGLDGQEGALLDLGGVEEHAVD